MSTNGYHPVHDHDFANLLRLYRARDGRPQNRLAKDAGMDPSYLKRIESAERAPPSLPIVCALALALRLPAAERDALLLAAGRAPVALAILGQWDPVLAAVTDVLNDLTLEDAERAEFRAVVLAICGRYHNWGKR